MRAFCVLLAVLILGVGVQAQTDDYRLRVPTISEFIAGIPDFEQTDEVLLFSNRMVDAVEAAELEFLHRYEDTASFTELNNAFNKLKTQVFFISSSDDLPAIDYNEWVVRIVQAWLDEHSLDLDTILKLRFPPYSVDVEQHDFNNDGQHEWIFDVTKGRDREEYRNYVVVMHQRDAYRVLKVPIPWQADGYTDESNAGGERYELGFRDINGDRLSEWIFSFGVSSVGPGYIFGYSNVYILGWEANQIVQLAVPEDVSIKDLDGDGIDELVATNVMNSDNWGCGTRIIRVYRWNGSRYEREPQQQESLDCTARYAEEAMWNGDFVTAARLYDAFIEQHQAEFDEHIECSIAHTEFTCGMNRNILIFKYFQARRIIAYGLLDQTNKVEILLKGLAEMPQNSDFGLALLEANTSDIQTLCATANHYFAEEFHPTPDEEMYQFIPGDVYEISDGWYIYIWRDFDPNRAGCDIRLFGDEPTPIPTLILTPYPTSPPPTPDIRPQEERWLSSQNVEVAYRTGDYDLALGIASEAVPYDEFDSLKWGYYRALALEALNRPDEALAEYVEIFQAAPESVWGQLAALHLEKI